MSFSLCIHGHFYQPPRENPWFGAIFPESSAAPSIHWNERITRESYGPLAYARQSSADGKIINIINAYEWINFNVGPTLLKWIQQEQPDLLRRLKEGDKKSIERLGYGNAIAQIYHHIIMPLATEEDKRREVRWAIDDFIFHFERKPQGMWLSECAVDSKTLSILAEEGIEFVILSPYQAKVVIVNGETRSVHEHGLDITEAYRISLPDNRSISAFFYNGPLSQSIAFQGLLADGERFWQRIIEEKLSLAKYSQNPLVAIATDGETYGHHFTFGEMALAYVLSQAATGRDGAKIENFASRLAAFPPQKEVLLLDVSSWSCAHGVERWRSDCGCKDGGHPDWNQKWRAPLREALDIMKKGVENHFLLQGNSYFSDPQKALLAYGKVLADPGSAKKFMKEHYQGPAKSEDTAWKLLQMQEQSLAAYASCAWFFDDISRIEPQNAMTYALRALTLLEETKGASLQEEFQSALAKAQSNKPEAGSGKDIFATEVVPRQDSDASLCLMACLKLVFSGKWGKGKAANVVTWPSVSIAITAVKKKDDGKEWEGSAQIKSGYEQTGQKIVWIWKDADSCFSSFFPHSHSLLNSMLIARKIDKNKNILSETIANVASLSRTLQDEILRVRVVDDEARHRPEMRQKARNLLDLFPGYAEAQQTMIKEEYWQSILPYLRLEASLDTKGLEHKKNDVVLFINKNTTKIMDRLSQLLLEEEMLLLMADENNSEIDLLLFADNVKKMYPEMDWWRIQNKIWESKKFLYTKFAFSLGFR